MRETVKEEKWWLYDANGLCVASGDRYAEGLHYARVYSQCGPVFLSLGKPAASVAKRLAERRKSHE